LVTRYDRRFTLGHARIFHITSHQWSKPRGDLARCQLANLTPQRATRTELAPRWRLRPGRRAPRRSSRAPVGERYYLNPQCNLFRPTFSKTRFERSSDGSNETKNCKNSKNASCHLWFHQSGSFRPLTV
jgi:hypothetical protein